MNIRCRECNKEIKSSYKLDSDDVRIFHTKCYTKFLKEYKEYGIRIGMRVHK